MKDFLRHNRIFILLVVLYLLTRLLNLTILPIFNDESIYLYWAKLIDTTHAHLFISLTDGKPPLLIWIMAVFLKLFPSFLYLLAGRLPSVIMGLISLFGIYALTSLLFHSRKTSLLAALLYIVSPFALVYDRMALFDSFLLSMLLWSAYFSIRTSQSLLKKDALLWGFFLGLAFLVKINALLFLFLTPLVFLLLIPRQQFGNNWKKIIATLALALGISQLLRFSLMVSSGYHEYTVKSVTRYALPLSTLIEHPFQVFPANIFLYTSWFIGYVTLPIFLLGLIGFILLMKTNWRTATAMLLLFVGPIIATSFVSIVTIPRYILFVLPYFLVAVSFAAVQMLKSKLLTAVFIVILLFPIVFDAALLFSPSNAPIPSEDYYQYVSGLPSGYGFAKIFSFFHHEAINKHITIITLGFFGSYPYAFNLEFWDNPHVTVLSTWPVQKNYAQKIATLAKKEPVYVVLKFNAYQEHMNFLKELHLHELFKAAKPNSNLPITVAIPQN